MNTVDHLVCPDKGNPFLTEFAPSSWLKRRWTYEGMMGTFAIWLALAGLPLGLGNWAGANCLWAKIIEEGKPDRAFPIAFGFLAEPNHGLFYLFGMLVFIGVVIALLEAAGSAIVNLANAKRIQSLFGKSPQETLSIIGDNNKQMFRWFWIVFPFIWAGVIFTIEWSHNKDRVFGWVQVAQVSKYHGAPLDEFSFTGRERVQQFFRLPQVDGGRSGQNKGVSQSGSTLTVRMIRPGFDDEVVKKNWEEREWRFVTFLFSAVFIEWFAHVIIAWVIFKVLFFVWILLSAEWVEEDAGGEEGNATDRRLIADQLVLRRWFLCPPKFKMALNFEDPRLRYGLSCLDGVYNKVLFLAVIGAGVFWASRISNLNKGTGWLPEDPMLSYAGQVILPLIILMVSGAVLGCPYWHLLPSVMRRKLERLERLVKDGQGVLDGDRFRRVESQSLWPGWESRYVFLVSLCFTFLVLLPLGIDSLVSASPGGVVANTINELAESYPRLMCPCKDVSPVSSKQSLDRPISGVTNAMRDPG